MTRDLFGPAPHDHGLDECKAVDHDDDVCTDDGPDADWQYALAEIERHAAPAWYDIARVATHGADPRARQDLLDLAWIDGLPLRLIEQIDGEFSVSAEDKSYRAEVAARGKQPLPADLRSQVAARRRQPNLAASVIATPKAGVTWAEGRTLARVNFIAWGINVLGSLGALRKHFESITEVPQAEGLFLSKEAAQRFGTARSWFAQKYPGNTFRPTTVGQSLRERHQGKHTRGELGHPLGIAVDFDAMDNPYQHDAVSQFMLGRFGGHDDERAADPQGSRMNLGSGGKRDAAVGQLGRATVAGKQPTADQAALLATARRELDEMVETSERFQASVPEADQNRLRAAAKSHRTLTAKLSAIDREIADAKAAAEVRDAILHLQTDPEDAWLRATPGADPAMALLIAERARIVAELDRDVYAVMEDVFAPWIDELEDDIDAMTSDGVKPDAKEIATRRELIRRLTSDPAAVFGGTDDTVAQPSVAQYLRRGFVRDDELNPNRPDPQMIGPPVIKSVFNGELVEAMIMHGFVPGASWTAVDTMHFDFIEGYDAIVGAEGKYGPGKK